MNGSFSADKFGMNFIKRRIMPITRTPFLSVGRGISIVADASSWHHVTQWCYILYTKCEHDYPPALLKPLLLLQHDSGLSCGPLKKKLFPTPILWVVFTGFTGIDMSHKVTEPLIHFFFILCAPHGLLSIFNGHVYGCYIREHQQQPNGVCSKFFFVLDQVK